jgi:uridine kinase
MTRRELLRRLADRITAVERPHPVRVAVDGVDAAGKTTLADALAPALEERGRPVIRASIDGFHRPRAERIRRGELSPEGYYRDSFDHDALISRLLAPLGPGGSRWYRRAAFDFRADRRADPSEEIAAADAVLIFDGVFLLRPELFPYWDFSVFVEVPLDISVARGVARDAGWMGSAEAARRRYRRRYAPGQRLYLAEARPAERADAVVRNADIESPELVERGA